MRTGWLALLILPVILLAKGDDRGFFFTLNSDDPIQHLVFEEEVDQSYPFGEIGPEDFDSQGLSFLEIDERDDSLSLWSNEQFAKEERTLQKIRKGLDLDEAFSFDLPSFLEGPDLENIPETPNHLVQISGLRP